MAAARVGGRWGEPGPVGFAGRDGGLQCVVDVEDGALGAIFAVLLLVLVADDGEGVQDVGDGVARGGEVVLELREMLGHFVVGAAVRAACWAPVAVFPDWQVEVEEGGVQLAAEDKAPLLVPTERWAVPATVAGEFTKVLARVNEFEYPRHQEFEIGFGVGIGGEDGGLLHREVLQVDSAEFLTSDEVEDVRVESAQQGSRQLGGGGGVHEEKLVSDRGKRDDVCNRRPPIRAVGDVAPAHQPAGRGAGEQFLGKRERFVLGPQWWDGMQVFGVRLERGERLRQGVGIDGIPSSTRTREPVLILSSGSAGR